MFSTHGICRAWNNIFPLVHSGEIENLDRAWTMIEKGLAIYRQCQITDTWDMPDMEVYTI
jgi:hypothetical protein